MENLQIVPLDDEQDGNYGNDDDLPSPGNEKIRVAKFDYSYENYFKVMNKILKISGEDDSSQFEFNQSEIQRMSSSVEFIR